MKTISSILCVLFLSSCQFLTSPLGLMIEQEALKDAEAIIEYELKPADPVQK